MNVLTVPNHHVEDSGKPPELIAEKNYTAYFENRLGEQLVFTYDRQNKKGILWHGDAGWDFPCAVNNGIADGIVLNGEERIGSNSFGEWLPVFPMKKRPSKKIVMDIETDWPGASTTLKGSTGMGC